MEGKNGLFLFLRTQLYFLKIVYRENPSSIFSFFLLALVTSILPPFLINLNKITIDTISTLKTKPETLDSVIYLLIIYFFINYFSEISRNIQSYIFEKISQTTNFVIKKQIQQILLSLPYQTFESSSFFNKLNLANMAINGNGVRVINNIIQIFGSTLSLFGILGLLLSIHWSLPLGLFISILPSIVIVFIGKKRRFQIQKKNLSTERELKNTDTLFFDRSALKEIKIYDIGDYLINKWSFLYSHIQKQTLKVSLWETKVKSYAAILMLGSSLVVSLLLVHQISNDNLSIGSYVALMTAVTTVQSLFSIIGGNLGSIFEVSIYNNSLVEILNNNEVELSKTNITIDCDIEKIEIKNASFSYPGSNNKTLDKISLTINQGEKISIVGFNGSGKTTLTKCILGLYDFDIGRIEVNGEDLRNINKRDFYKKVSIIYQDFYKYGFSVRENVGVGNIVKLNEDALLNDVLKEVGMYEVVNNYKNQLDTYLSKEMPEGKELSGGEWQKIAIARALIKDADLIILDEPTSALDPISEMKIFNLFYRLSKGKTTITTSHRIGPTRLSDRIIVMEQGRIVEEGSYKDLMNLKGRYYEMYMSQASWYNEHNFEAKWEEVI
ncbi:Heterocyst differentiation ATP-binding protein HepA [compost metagenome]